MHMKRSIPWTIALGIAMACSLARAEVVDIGNEELKALVTRGIPVVDLRTPGEWRQTGVVKGSQMIMLFDEQGRADLQAWQSRLDQVAPPGKPVILICRTGNRSGLAAQLLAKGGRKGTVYNVKSGIVSWIRDGQGTVSPQENLKQAGISCTPTC